MDDLILPLALAFAISVVAQFVMATILAVLRDWTLRKGADRRKATPSTPLELRRLV